MNLIAHAINRVSSHFGSKPRLKELTLLEVYYAYKGRVSVAATPWSRLTQ